MAKEGIVDSPFEVGAVVWEGPFWLDAVTGMVVEDMLELSFMTILEFARV